MKTFNQWLLWMPVKRPNGKIDKIPCSPRTLLPCSAHDPAEWTDYNTARGLAVNGYGLAFALSKVDPFWFLDIDHCVSGGQWTPLAVQLMGEFVGCYVEVSQSGEGLHIIGSMTGPEPAHGCKNIPLGLEMYTSGRFVAVTGSQATGSASYVPPQGVQSLIDRYFPPQAAGPDPVEWTDGPVPEWGGYKQDAALIKHMLTSKGASSIILGRATAKQLWERDVDVLAAQWPDGGDGREFDYSSADAALCQHLAFWTGKDCARMERLFAKSGLVREKWTEREDYRHRTILGACARCSNVHKGRKPVEAAAAPGEKSEIDGMVVPPSVQLEHFKGCVYVSDKHAVFSPRYNGRCLNPDRFKVLYGGKMFDMDNRGEKQSKDAWEVFTQSRAIDFPKVDNTCFRPELTPGETITDCGDTLVNTYIPTPTESEPGDVEPFLGLLRKLFPNDGDRAIVKAYLAACVQHLGAKFNWCVLVQGMEGNGKSFITDAMVYAIGKRYSHKPSAPDIGNKFNDWIENKVFIGVEEICVGHNREMADILKTMITGDTIEIQPKGGQKYMADNRANFYMNSNHKDAVAKTEGNRRYAVFYTPQQEFSDLAQWGMDGTYFPDLYDWLRADGHKYITYWLQHYPIPAGLNPAGLCQRAPKTTSLKEAIEVSLSPAAQDIKEAIECGIPGFCGGWVSSMAVVRILDKRKLSPNKVKTVLNEIGYIPHPALSGGRLNNPVLQDGGKPRLYVPRDGLTGQITGGARIREQYMAAQGYLGEQNGKMQSSS